MQAADQAKAIRDQLPPDGLFAGHEWRMPVEPFPLEEKFVRDLSQLGRVLRQFYHAADLLYRHSVAGKQPTWVAEWLEQGKPDSVIQRQRDKAFKTALPRVIRPDILLTENGWHITELDSVPGGIGLTDRSAQDPSRREDAVRPVLEPKPTRFLAARIGR